MRVVLICAMGRETGGGGDAARGSGRLPARAGRAGLELTNSLVHHYNTILLHYYTTILLFYYTTLRLYYVCLREPVAHVSS